MEKTLDQKIQERKEQQQKELESFIKEQTAKELIFKTLDLPEDTKLSPHVAYADYMVTLSPVETLSDAIYKAEIDNPLALFMVKDSCTAFMPETTLDAYLAKNKNAEEECIGAYIYQIGGIYGHQEEKTLIYFVSAGDFTVQVNIPVSNDPDTRRTYRRVDFRGGYRIEDCKIINNSGHFRRSIRWWSSPEHPNSFTLY